MLCQNCNREIYWDHENLGWRHFGDYSSRFCDLHYGTFIAEPKVEEPKIEEPKKDTKPIELKKRSLEDEIKYLIGKYNDCDININTLICVLKSVFDLDEKQNIELRKPKPDPNTLIASGFVLKRAIIKENLVSMLEGMKVVSDFPSKKTKARNALLAEIITALENEA